MSPPVEPAPLDLARVPRALLATALHFVDTGAWKTLPAGSYDYTVYTAHDGTTPGGGVVVLTRVADHTRHRFARDVVAAAVVAPAAAASDFTLADVPAAVLRFLVVCAERADDRDAINRACAEIPTAERAAWTWNAGADDVARDALVLGRMGEAWRVADMPTFTVAAIRAELARREPVVAPAPLAAAAADAPDAVRVATWSLRDVPRPLVEWAAESAERVPHSRDWLAFWATPEGATVQAAWAGNRSTAGWAVIERRADRTSVAASAADLRAELARRAAWQPSGSTVTVQIHGDVFRSEETAGAVMDAIEKATRRGARRETTMTTKAPSESVTPVASLAETLTRDATDAGVRVAASQLTKAVRDPLCGLIARGLGDDSEALRARLAAFLATDVGTALVGALVSAGLATMPGDVAATLARELRVASAARAGDVLADLLGEPVRQVAALYLRGTPAVAVATAPALDDGASATVTSMAARATAKAGT